MASIVLALLILGSSLALAIGIAYWSSTQEPLVLLDFGGKIAAAEAELSAAKGLKGQLESLQEAQKASEEAIAAAKLEQEKAASELLTKKLEAKKQVLAKQLVQVSGVCASDSAGIAILSSNVGLGTHSSLANSALKLSDVRAFDIPEGLEVELMGPSDAKPIVLSAGNQSCLRSLAAGQPDFAAKGLLKSFTVRIVNDEALKALVAKTL